MQLAAVTVHVHVHHMPVIAWFKVLHRQHAGLDEGADDAADIPVHELLRLGCG
jgi:hypothetical protein